MAFSDRGLLLEALPNLYFVLLAFFQPCLAYVVVRIPTCSSFLWTLLQNPKVTFSCCLDSLVTKVTGGQFMDGFSHRKSLKLSQYQQHVVNS